MEIDEHLLSGQALAFSMRDHVDLLAPGQYSTRRPPAFHFAWTVRLARQPRQRHQHRTGTFEVIHQTDIP